MYNISNSNYFPVEVTGVKMISTYDNKQITMVTNTTILKLPTRGLATYYVTMNFIFEKENDWDFLVWVYFFRAAIGDTLLDMA